MTHAGGAVRWRPRRETVSRSIESQPTPRGEVTKRLGDARDEITAYEIFLAAGLPRAGPRSRASGSRHYFNHVASQSLPRPPYERRSLPSTALAARILHRSDVHSLALPETVERAQSV
jgi:hypothetical protein